MNEVEAKLMKGNLLKGGIDEYSQVIATDKSIPKEGKVMNEEMGLAQEAVSNTKPMRELNQIIELIMQGMSPEELIQQGIPKELVMMAMQEISKAATQVPDKEAGLAAQQVQALPRMQDGNAYSS